MKINKSLNRGNKVEIKTDQELAYLYEELPSYLQFPYIGTQHYKDIVDLNEDIVIPVYITDFHQKEYLYDDTSEVFSVHYRVGDNAPITITGIPAGDNTVTIGGIATEGLYEIALYAIDSRGIQSQVIYKMVWVREESSYIASINAHTYTITQQDLDRYGIKNNGSADPTDLTNTCIGLTSLFAEIKENGYRKAILLQGIYRVPYGDGSNVAVIQIPSEFTLDMNGATFKQNRLTQEEYLQDKGTSICQMTNCFDSHLMNGTIDGDYIERLEVDEELGKNYITGSMGEHVGAFEFKGLCKFCTFENMNVNNVTGHALGVIGNTHHYHMTLNPSVDVSVPWASNTCINPDTGIVEPTNLCCLSGYYNISNKIQYEYMIFGVFMGYGGLIGGISWNYIAFWYDEQQNYIGHSNGHMYRKLKFPSNAHYVRIAIVANSYTPNFYSDMLYYYEYNSNCSFTNVTCNNCRACALAPAYYKDLLLKDVNMTNCGQSITPAPIDFEDGWQNGQDAYLINVSAKRADRGSDLLIICSGFNYLLDNVNMGLLMRAGTYGLTVRNGDINNTSRFTVESNGWGRNGYTRIYNMTFTNTGVGMGSTLNSVCPRVMKGCTVTGGQVALGSYLDCTFENCTTYGNPEFINCTVNNIGIIANTQPIFKHCEISFSAGSKAGGRYLCSKLNNSTIPADYDIYIDSCELNNLYIKKEGWMSLASIRIRNSIITCENNFITISGFNSSKQFEFIDNVVNITNGHLLFFNGSWSGNFLFKFNKITLPIDKWVYTYDSSWHPPNGDVFIEFIKNELLSGAGYVFTEVANSEYVTIIEKAQG